MEEQIINFVTGIFEDGEALTAIATGIGGLTIGLSLKKKLRWGNWVAPLVRPVFKAIRKIFKK